MPNLCLKKTNYYYKLTLSSLIFSVILFLFFLILKSLGIIFSSNNDLEKLIDSRNKARANKDFESADSIRDELSSMGIEIEDTSTGTIWKSI